MRTGYFFNGSWAGQLLIGFGLFLCSLFIEYQVLIHFISPPSLAVLLCVTMEGGKVAAVIWHYYLGALGDGAYLPSIRIASAVFRFGLVLLSILCSMLFLTSHLDRPNLARVREQRLQQLTREEERIIGRKTRDYQQAAAALTREQRREAEDSARQGGRRIDELESLLLKEMNNVVGGVFKGKRYRELARRLAAEKKAAAHQAQSMRVRQFGEQQQLRRELEDSLAAIRRDFAAKKQRLLEKDFTDDEAVNDARIVALLKTMRTMFGLDVRPQQFVFFFSILVSLLMETGIMLAFATITTAIAPVLQERHIGEMELEATRLRAETVQAREETRHHASMAMMKQAAENIVGEAASAGDHIMRQQEGTV